MKATALISKTEAFRRLSVTGLSKEARLKKAAELATEPDGKRFKVRASVVEIFIREKESMPQTAVPKGIKPISNSGKWANHRRRDWPDVIG